MEPYFIFSKDNILIWLNGTDQYTISSIHPNYTSILEALNEERYDDLESLINIKRSLETGIDGITVDSSTNTIFYKGRPLHNTLTKRIVQFINEGLPWKPLARFLENLMQNPSYRAINELYDFLEHEGMAITTDGHFMAYKGVDHDYMDRWSRTINNSPGKVIEVDRSEVNDDCTVACGKGFHVGSYKYANSWRTQDGILLLVKVNPRDAVSVPRDHNCEKLRVCRYEVVKHAPAAPLEEAAVETDGSSPVVSPDTIDDLLSRFGNEFDDDDLAEW